MKARFFRLSGFFSEAELRYLQRKRVAVVGLGGVGGYALEALQRTGVGKFVLIDCDKISETNLNRQLLATTETIGMRKTELAALRLKAIDPETEVETYDSFYEGGTEPFSGADYIVDAIDTVTAKIKLIEAAKQLKIPVISAMGTGNKLDPLKLRTADISETRACPLARVMRRELKARGITGVKTVFSEEEPISATSGEEAGRHPPMSAIFVPAAAGLLIAKEVVFDLIGAYRAKTGAATETKSGKSARAEPATEIKSDASDGKTKSANEIKSDASDGNNGTATETKHGTVDRKS